MFRVLLSPRALPVSLRPLCSFGFCLLVLALGLVTRPEAGLAAFADSTNGLPLSDPSWSVDAGWADVNNDGYPDLYVLNYAQANKLLLNNAGTFVDGSAAPLNSTDSGNSMAWGDYDNDGLLDLVVVNVLGGKLYHNLDGVNFADVTPADLSATQVQGSVVWADYDGDGDIDISVAGNGELVLLENDGQGGFTKDVGASLALPNSGVDEHIWFDYDGDGYVDVFIAYACALCTPTTQLFRNLNGAGLQDVTTSEMSASLPANNGRPFGAAAGDYDNDGDLDLFVAIDGTVYSQRLYRNDGGTFVLVTPAPINVTDGRGAAWVDYDNDGWLDLNLWSGTACRMFRNNGNGTFTEDLVNPPVPAVATYPTYAWADYDLDGDLDVYGAGNNSNTLSANQGNANHWLHVNLQGVWANAVGARVRLVGGGKSQIREVGTGRSAGSLTVEFGLGAAAWADSLIIFWPSGQEQVFESFLIVDRVMNVIEPRAPMTDIASGPMATSGGTGTAWVDVDGDGDQDLFFGVEFGPNQLMRNDGNLQFTDVTPDNLKNTSGKTVGSSWADYDNDGDPDVYLFSEGANSKLFRNDGGLKFTDVTGLSPNLGSFVYPRAASWVDYDLDGDLDLCVISRGPNRLFRNDGNDVFTEVPGAIPTAGESAVWGDFDNDGDPDLYVSNETIPNQLLVNDGQGGLTDSGMSAIDVLASATVDFGDYNNDGFLDLFVAVWDSVKLLENVNGTGFVDVTDAKIPPLGGNFQGVAWGDANLDGRQDIFVSSGYLDESMVLINLPTGFVEQRLRASNVVLRPRAGGAWADADGDGDLDLYVSALAGPNQFFENAVSDSNWIQLDLTGTVSNRSAIGAQVRAHTGSAVQMREIAGNSGYQSQNSLTVEFGLGSAASVPQIDINWPSGNSQVLRNVTANQKLNVVEPRLTATDDLEYQVNLTWTSPTSANYVHAVWRDLDPMDATPAELVAVLPGDQTSYTDYLGAADSVYTYTVNTAINPGLAPVSSVSDLGSRAPADSLSASDGLYENRVDLSWNAAESPNFYYIISRDDDTEDMIPAELLTYASSLDSTYKDLTGTPDVVYTYCVEMYLLPDSVMVSRFCDDGYRVFRGPSDLVASDELFSDQVEVTWLDNSFIESGYELTRSPAEMHLSSGEIEELMVQPASLDSGLVVDNTNLRFYQEESAYTLLAPLTLDVADSGSFVGNESATGILPAGTTISSYMLHGERATLGIKPRYVGQITFDRKILGVIIDPANLVASDYLGSPTIIPVLSARGLESLDIFTISDDRYTLSVDVGVTSARDQIRIITEAGSQLVSLGPNQTAYVDHGALPDVSYNYCVQGYVNHTFGGVTTRVDASLICDDGMAALILPPAAVWASDGEDSTRVVVRWEDQTDNEQGFWIYRDMSPTPIAFVPENTQVFTDATNLGVQHLYCVTTVMDTALVVESRLICDTGIGGDSTMVAPMEFTASDGTYDDRVELRWRDIPTEDEFQVFRDGTWLATVGQDEIKFTDKTSAPGVTHKYELMAAAHADTARSILGGTSVKVPTNGKRSVVVAPTQVTASNGDYEDRVDVSWNSISTTAVMFTVYRDGVPIKTAPGHFTSCPDFGADTGEHVYCVTAVTASGVESPMTCDGDSTGFRAIHPPSGVAASFDEFEHQVLVSWDDASSVEDGYRVWRKIAGAPGDSTEIGTTPANRTSYTDGTGVPGVTYKYSVFAFDELGQSKAVSDVGRRWLKAPTQVAATDGTFEDQIEITWKDESNRENGFRIYRRVTGDAADSVLVGTTGSNILGFVDNAQTNPTYPVVLGENYTYYVVAFDTHGESVSRSDAGFTKILAPGSVQVSDSYPDKYVVTWVDRSSIETGYEVYRNNEVVPLATTGPDTTMYVDTDTGSAVRTYSVRAISGTDMSEFGTDAGALTPATPGPGGDLTGDNLIANRDVSGPGDRLGIGETVDASGGFGWSVAIGKKRAVVGDWGAYTPTDNSGNVPAPFVYPLSYAGAAFVYELSNGVWESAGDPLYPDLPLNDTGGLATRTYGYGWSVAMSSTDDVLIVGDPSAVADNYFGRAYVYEYISGSWELADSLKGDAGDGLFGGQVDIDGNTATVLSYNGLYFFERSQQTGHWVRVQMSNLFTGYRDSDSYFGKRLGLHDGVAAVLEVPDHVRIFEKNGTWPPVPTASVDIASPTSVDVDGGNVLVGSYSGTASAYVVKKVDGVWTQTEHLVPEVPLTGWGQVSIRDNVAAIGAENIANTPRAVSVFSANEDGWFEAHRVEVETDADAFGAAVVLGQDHLLVGAPDNQTDYGPDRGLVGHAVFIPLPSNPTDIAASDGTFKNMVQVRWTDRSSVEDGYKVYRDGELVETTGPSARQFNDTGAQPGRTHEYSVVAFMQDGYDAGGRGESDYGRRPPDGTVSGRVSTRADIGVPGVEVCVEPSPNTAILLDGIGGYLRTNKTFGAPENFIVDMWVNPRPRTGNATLLSKAGDVLDSFAIGLSSAGNVMVEWEGNSFQTTGTLSSDEWHHLVVTVSYGGSSLKLVQVVVDGVLDEQSLVGGLSTTLPADSWALGARWDGTSATEFFEGRIDEVRLWETVGGEDPIPLAYWPLDQLEGPAAEDLTENAYYAVLVDGAYWASESAPGEVCAVTDNEGNFTITRIRYGDGKDFRVRPTDPLRDFQPEYKLISLDPQSPVENEVRFTDITSYTIAGRIAYANGCDAGGIVLRVDDQPRATTDRDGVFALSVDPGDHVLTPFLDGHTFDPPSFEFTATQDSSGIDFTDVTTRLLSGRVGGRCEGVSVGTLSLEIRSLDGCLVDTLTSSTDYSIELPPLKYEIVVTSVTDIPSNLNDIAVRRFFEELGGQEADLTEGPQVVDVLYTAPLVVEVTGWTGETPANYDQLILPGGGQGALPDAIIDQLDRVPLTIHVYEDYGVGGLCAVDSATVTIFDEVIDNEDPVEVPLRNGYAEYETAANTPNVYPGRTDLQGGNRSYQKALTVFVEVPGLDPVRHTEWVLVNGHRPRPASFTTVAEELPVLVLRDPPGDHSYSFMEEETTNCTTIGGFVQASLSTFQEYRLYAGARFTTGFMFLSETIAQAFTTNQFEVGITANGGGEMEVCTTLKERYSTSPGETFIGPDANVYLGVGINFSFAKTDVVETLKSAKTRTVNTFVSNTVGAEGVETATLYTEKHIRDHLIPEQEELARELRANGQAGEAVIWESSVQNLQSWIGLSDSLRTAARVVKNRSFSAGADYQYSQTTTEKDSRNWSVALFTDIELSRGFNFKVTGVGSEAKNGTRIKMNAQVGGGKSTTNARTVGYVLSDDDIGDYYSVDVKEDKYFGTPVFDVSALGTLGTSSCPREPWYDENLKPHTQPRDSVYITLQPVDVGPYDPDSEVVFQLDMTNASPTDEDREYVLFPIQTSNPGGALLKVNGGGFAGGASFFLPAGRTSEATLTVSRGPRKYTYDDLQIVMAPACEIENWRNGGAMQLADTLTFNVEFKAPCSDIDLYRPLPGWIVNDTSIMDIQLVDFQLYTGGKNDDTTFVQAIGASYRPAGSKDTPILIQSIPVDQNNPPDLQGVHVYWESLPTLPDGDYEVLAWTQCSDKKFYSSAATGTIDRSAALVKNITPADGGILSLNGKISITFTEDIDCAAVKLDGTTPNVKLERSSNGGVTWNSVSLKSGSQKGVVCDERSLVITPLSPTLAELENQMLRATVSGIKDLSGNPMAADTTWSFTVQRNVFVWGAPVVSKDVPAGAATTFPVDLVNGLTQDVDFVLTGIPDWLSVSPDSGGLNALDQVELTFGVGDTLTLGQNYSGIVTAEAYSPGTTTLLASTPLTVNLDVICGVPTWTVNPADYQYSMTIVAEVKKGPTGSIPAENPNDILGAFVGTETRGVAHIEQVDVGGQTKYLAFMNVYGKFTQGERIRFKIYDSETCVTADGDQVVRFVAQGSKGTLTTPLIVASRNSLFSSEQTIPVETGWNWFSLNRKSNFPDGMVVPEVLGNLNPLPGDQLKNHFQGFATFTDSVGWEPLGGLDTLDVKSTYLLSVSTDGIIRHRGNAVDLCTTGVPADSGWSWIGYPAQWDSTLDAALMSLSLVPGDLLVSQDQFAEYDGGKWVGSLKLMKPGEGYKLLLHTLQSPDSLYYPNHPDSLACPPAAIQMLPAVAQVPRIAGGLVPGGGRGSLRPLASGGSALPVDENGEPDWTVNPRRYRYNMTVSARVSFEKGQKIDASDLVVAVVGSEIRGVTHPRSIGDPNAMGAFLMVYGNEVSGETVEFKVYDPAEHSLYDVAEVLSFAPDAIYGANSLVPLTAGGLPEILGNGPIASVLSANFPNPFHASEATTIRFALPEAQHVTLRVFDVAGRVVATLLDKRMDAGWHDVPYQPNGVAAGLYFYRLQTGGESLDRKMLILR